MQWEMESSRLIRCLDPGPLVLVPHTVREIAPHAFSDCTEVVQLVLPNTLERVYDCAFSGCTNLRQVSLHVGVRLRAYGIFKIARSLPALWCAGAAMRYRFPFQWMKHTITSWYS